MQYQAPDGRIFRAPQSDPSVPAPIATRLSGIIGLDTASVYHTHCKSRLADLTSTRSVAPRGGTGPGGGLTPNDIKAAYNLSGASQSGSGQVLALFELSGYRPSDVAAYEQHFGLPSVPLQNVLIDGYSGADGNGANEVTLDIELMIALAPGASNIMVYEGPNSGNGVIDTYNRIATDNLARQISTSWGLDETSAGSSRIAENAVFQQMAAQGQTIYSAAGDSGAYDNGSTIGVDDPSSQPYVTGVGGTKLKSGVNAVYQSETTWNGGSIASGAGGGGKSTFWPLPSYQLNSVTTASIGSTTMRNVPDVSLNSDPNFGYSIYFHGQWAIYGGTSCAAPLWAGFTALVNQQRAANGVGALGFANPLIYGIGRSARYNSNFHDIADQSTNLFYPAVKGYDLATGWGSFNGAGLLATMISGVPVPFDFNGDMQSDLPWQNQTTGDVTYWVLNNGAYAGSWSYLARNLPTAWKLAVAPDLNGDAQPTPIWQNLNTGDMTYWVLDKGTYSGKWGYIARGVPLDWKLVTSADLFGDGSNSLVLQNQTNGDVVYWKMSGTHWDGAWNYLARGVPTDWKIVGSYDLDGDGQSDLIWQNQTTGDVSYWSIRNGAYTGTWAFIARGIPTVWKIEGVLDVTGDGIADLIWRNQSTGDVSYWEMNGSKWTGRWSYIARNVPTAWKIVGVH